MLLSSAIARRVVGHGTAAAVAIWLGTPLLFYMYVAPPFSHAPSAFAVALFVTIWLKVRKTWSIGGAVALGLAAALMAMVREQDLFCALGATVDFFITSGRLLARASDRLQPPLSAKSQRGSVWGWGRKRAEQHGSPRAVIDARQVVVVAAAGVAAFLIGYLPQLLAYQALNGFPRPSPLVMRKMFWYSPHAWQVRLHPR